jgi:prepilin signal peptidase PulO-like enzyme (type II secretory pathway)
MAIAYSYLALRGVEGLGQGDWKLAAMMGAFVGVQRLMLVVFLASLTGMIYGLVKGTRARARETTAQTPPEPATGDSTDAPSDPPKEAESLGKFRLPFGTFLAGAAVFVLLTGDGLLDWYQSLFVPRY